MTVTTDDFEGDVARLRAAALLTGEGAVQAVDAAVSKVVAHRDPSSIGTLLLLLNDSAEHDEGMFSLIHAAESFDDHLYVRELLSSLPELCRVTPRWASIVLMRVLNNQSSREMLVRSIQIASNPAKEAVKWLCEKINDRSPTFLNKTLPVIVAAST